jgi:hypothetical protein
MKYHLFIILILLNSCVTQKKIERYLIKHPEAIETVFIINDVHDTIAITKDSLVIERIADTLYQWLNDTHYIDRVRIKKVLQPCKDSIIIVSKNIYVDRYKKVYELAKKDAAATDKMFRWWRKGALLTWAWIILIAGVIYIIKSR